MSEAFEVGVTLALSDGVSEGIERARQDMQRFEQVLSAGGLSIGKLRETAMRAVHPGQPLSKGTRADTTTKPDVNEPVGDGQQADDRPMPRPRAANIVQDVPALRSVSAAPGVHSPNYVGAQPSDIVEDGTSKADGDLVYPGAGQRGVPTIPATAASAPGSSERPLPQGEPQKPPENAAAPIKPAHVPAEARDRESGIDVFFNMVAQRAETLPPPWDRAGASVSSPSPPQRAPSAPAALKGGPAAPQRFQGLDDPAQPMLAAWQDHVDTAPTIAREASARAGASSWSAPQNTEPAAPQAAVGTGQGPVEGDVFLDGMLVGRWMSKFLRREAERAPAGPTGFDSRRSRILPGPTVGG